GHRRRRPGPALRDDPTRRQGGAVLARDPGRATRVPVGPAATGSWHERRPSVGALRLRLSRGNAPLPDLRRRSHAPSQVERDRDGSRDRATSKARLSSRVLAAKSRDHLFTVGFILVGLDTLAQASCLMLVNTSIGLLVVRELGLGPQVVGAVIGFQAT